MMNTSDSDNGSGMTVLAMAFRLARGKPLACYMCKHSDVSDTRLCTLGMYAMAWHKMWEMLEETAPDPTVPSSISSWKKYPHQRMGNHSAAEFCTNFEYSPKDMLNSRDQMLLDELTKV